VTDSRIFCLDTSALINPWNHYYAPDLTPGYWRDVPQMVRDGRAVLSEEVREELERIDDGLRQWARTNILAWHPLTDPIQEVVRDIMANWGKLAWHGARGFIFCKISYIHTVNPKIIENSASARY